MDSKMNPQLHIFLFAWNYFALNIFNFHKNIMVASVTWYGFIRTGFFHLPFPVALPWHKCKALGHNVWRRLFSIHRDEVKYISNKLCNVCSQLWDGRQTNGISIRMSDGYVVYAKGEGGKLMIYQMILTLLAVDENLNTESRFSSRCRWNWGENSVSFYPLEYKFRRYAFEMC